jgi:hypothetical protein
MSLQKPDCERQTHFFFDLTGAASAIAASAVSIRKENVSCKYKPTVVSVWFK